MSTVVWFINYFQIDGAGPPMTSLNLLFPWGFGFFLLMNIDTYDYYIYNTTTSNNNKKEKVQIGGR